MSTIITFEVENYITEDKIAKIIEREYIHAINTAFSRGDDFFVKFFTKGAQQVVYDVINDYFTENGVDLKKELAAKIKEAINDLDKYDLFRGPEWSRLGYIVSEPYKMLNEVVKENRDYIDKKVKDIIDAYPFENLEEEDIMESIQDTIYRHLFLEKRLYKDDDE